MKQRSWLFYLWLIAALLVPASTWANPQMQKAIKHFKDFEIRQGLKIFKQLENDGSLPNSQKAKAAMYAGMSYAYIRKKSDALVHFRKALQLDPNIQLPKGTPSRLRKLFNKAKASAGSAAPAAVPTPRPTPRPTADPLSGFGGGTRTTPPRPAPVVPRPQPRPSSPSAFDPPPARRASSPPPRRRFSFGSFNVRRATPRPRPQPRREAFFPAPRRRVASPMIDDRPKPVRRTRRYRPRPKPRRVAMGNPSTGDTFNPGLSGVSKPKSRGGSGLLIAGGVVAGVGVAMAGVGIAMGAMASNQAGLAKNPETYQLDVPAIERDANSSALIANIMFIGAGVAVATGVVLMIVHATKPKPKPKNTLLSPISQRKVLPPPSKTVPPPSHAKARPLFVSP